MDNQKLESDKKNREGVINLQKERINELQQNIETKYNELINDIKSGHKKEILNKIFDDYKYPNLKINDIDKEFATIEKRKNYLQELTKFHSFALFSTQNVETTQSACFEYADKEPKDFVDLILYYTVSLLTGPYLN